MKYKPSSLESKIMEWPTECQVIALEMIRDFDDSEIQDFSNKYIKPTMEKMARNLLVECVKNK